MTADNFRESPPYGFTAVDLPEPIPTRTEFSLALTATLKEELEAFGEEITWRNVKARGMAGTSKETKAMMAAGYYESEAVNLVILPPADLGATDTTNPKPNEIIVLREARWRIEEVEHLEQAHGFQLIIQRLP